MTSARRVGCLVQDLTLSGVLPAKDGYDDPENPADVVKTLARGLRNIRDSSVDGRLASLKLHAARLDPPIIVTQEDASRMGPDRWRVHWRVAEWTFGTVCAALAISGLHIDSLDVFGSIQHCSLACDALQPALDSNDLSTSLAQLQKLSLSLSNNLHDHNEGDGHDGETVSRFVEFCPSLVSLELHWYNTAPARPNIQSQDYLFFNTLANSVRLLYLQSLSLRGIYVTESSLLSFLSHAAPLTSLIMEETHLTTGSFTPIFATVVLTLDHLHLDTLYSPEGMLQFFGPGKPHFPTSGEGRKGPFHLQRDGADARQPIQYDFVSGYSLGSPDLHRRMEWRARHYGPPPAWRQGELVRPEMEEQQRRQQAMIEQQMQLRERQLERQQEQQGQLEQQRQLERSRQQV
ncbi:hypothetical protein K461DRAFT_280428 [Myriangium duriaei CBS 260.36]|uniref:Uncharacterized protein n=1 Tax=Myriangium duriaei CBS 260.36 TaxID=1168546 RepID=A0A9P4IX19_9PEZI|nr:hypothetical protein K461DRAFT_280428 [Myriangium duriaei CBS 260.36]